MGGSVAIVLHAHLPYVRHPEHARPLEERWLHEAIWECYLPLLDAIARLRADGIEPALAVSISPPLASMLVDPLLKKRFEEHLDRLDRVVATNSEDVPLLSLYRARLTTARATWERIEGNVLGAFVAEHRAGGLELFTTSATHAYLPGLLVSPASVRAQITIGLRAFESLTSIRPIGFWLPECAYDPRFDAALATAGVRFSILDAHALELAKERPPLGAAAPVLSPNGVAFFGRDPSASRDVWSRKSGYPGDPLYREFYRDVGFDLPRDRLGDEIGPWGTRVMTGLKVHRITGPGDAKEPYDPERASARAREHAEHFVRARGLELAEFPEALGDIPIVVAPFDAELFGHWWFEGPEFLEHVFRLLDREKRAGSIRAITPSRYLELFPDAPIAEPAASSWGEGGFGEVWAGPEAARLWRHVHHVERTVLDAVRRHRRAEGLAGHALDLAIVQMLLLEASDWAFMLRRGEMVEYAESRVRRHASRALRLAKLAGDPNERITVDEVAFVHAVADEDRFLSHLDSEALRSACDVPVP